MYIILTFSFISSKMEPKEEQQHSPEEIKPKVAALETDPQPTQNNGTGVIRRNFITPAGTIIESNEEQPPEPTAEEIVKTSASTPSPVEQKVERTETTTYSEILTQEQREQFPDTKPYAIEMPAENFENQNFAQDISYTTVNIEGNVVPVTLSEIEHPGDYANLQTAQYNNGYADGSQYLAQHQYQNLFINRSDVDNSSPTAVLYRGDPNLADSRYQVSY